MKTILIYSTVVLLTGCATKKPAMVQMPRSVPGTMLPSDGIESVRHAENLKAYPIGRYVDPNNGLMMHEGHTIYRVETTAKWNLQPNRPVYVPGGPVVGIVDPAHRPGPLSAEVVAEVQKQKALSQSLLEQSGKINSTLGHLSNSISDTKQIAEQNARLRSEVSIANQRLELLENQLRNTPNNSNFTTVEPRSKGTNSW